MAVQGVAVIVAPCSCERDSPRARASAAQRKKFPNSQQNFGNPKLLHCNLSPTMAPVNFQDWDDNPQIFCSAEVE